MRFKDWILSICFFFPIQSVAHKVETKDYVLSLFTIPNHLCVQSKQKGFDSVLIALPGKPKCVVAHDVYAYVTYIQGTLITCVDLQKKAIVKSFRLNQSPSDMLLFSGHLYIVHARTERLSIVDPQSETRLAEFLVGHKPSQIRAYKDVAWIINEGSRFISVFNLKSSQMLPTQLVPNHPREVIFYEDIAYIFCPNDLIILIYDLLRNRLIRSLNIPYGSRSMILKDSTIQVSGAYHFPVFPHSRRLWTPDLPHLIGHYAPMCPGAFSVGCVEPLISKQVLLDPFFKELVGHLSDSARLFKNELYEWLLPDEILMLIELMKDESFVQSIDWVVLRRKLYQKLCLRLWMGHLDLSKRLIIQLLLLDEPEIKKIVQRAYKEGLWGTAENSVLAQHYAKEARGILRTR